MEHDFVKDHLALLLEHFGSMGDPREGCKVKYPLCEVLFLVTSATIAGCDDYDEVVAYFDDPATAVIREVSGQGRFRMWKAA